MNIERAIEVCLWVSGLSLLVVYGAARAWSGYASHQGIDAMREARAHSARPRLPEARPRTARRFASKVTTGSQSLVDAYVTDEDPRTPLAVLRIPSLSMEVPVYSGTSSAVLNRGAGWIEDTAQPGAQGNSGIAAHRDSFFRPLETIKTGADVYVDRVGRTRHYQVSRILVVAPQDVSVLDATATPTITLVTCYPFYFVGAAPQRFIVHATLAQPSAD